MLARHATHVVCVVLFSGSARTRLLYVSYSSRRECRNTHTHSIPTNERTLRTQHNHHDRTKHISTRRHTLLPVLHLPSFHLSLFYLKAPKKMKLFTSTILFSLVLSTVTAFMAPVAQPAASVKTTSALFMADAVQNKQKEYGKSLELPTTYVRCGRCQSVYAMTADDLGNGKGSRLECSVCKHSWFQSRERLMDIRDGYELVTLPDQDKERIALNLEEGKSANFMGEIKLYVGNISFECDEDQIREVFEEIGGVGDVSLVKDDLGRNRGFGFVTMRNKADGEAAMEKLDGSEVNGRNIAVRESTN